MRRPVRVAALIVGAVFLAAGVLGFVPGLVTGYGELRFAGPDADARLFGLFAVSVLHNVVHLGFGALGLAAAAAPSTARVYLLWGGGLYVLLAVYGVGIDRSSAFNILPVNAADNWLHAGLGIGMIALGVLTTAVERSRETAEQRRR